MDPSWVLAGGYEGGEGGESIERVLTIGPDISHITANPTGRTSSPPYYPDLLATENKSKLHLVFVQELNLQDPLYIILSATLLRAEYMQVVSLMEIIIFV